MDNYGNLEETTLISMIKVRPGAEKQFADWQERMTATVSAFPDFVSVEMQPSQDGSNRWTTVQRFRTAEGLGVWRHSKKRKKLLEEARILFTENQEGIKEVESSTYKEGGSVTEVFVTRVKPGKDKEYRDWASKVQLIEAQFQGYLGVYLQPPEDEQRGSWITIVRFDTQEHLDDWMKSRERQEILNEAIHLVEHLQSHRVASPFAGWFADFTRAKGEVPSPWKQSMLVLLVLYPLVMLELRFLYPLLEGLNPALKTFTGNAITVTLVSWPLLPTAIYFLGWWLAPGFTKRRKKTIIGIFIVVSLYIIEIISLWKLLL